MPELDSDQASLGMDEIDNSFEWGDLRVLPDSGIFRGDLRRGGSDSRREECKDERTRPSGTTEVASITIAPIPRVAIDP
jgi:hypothetical protein